MHLKNLLCAVAIFAIGCGGDDDPIAFSAPVAINIKAKAEETNNGVVTSEEKSITTEQGNPYLKFINDALVALHQREPSRIDVSSATLQLGAGSKDVVKLEEVLAGTVEVLFLMDSTKNTFNVATIANPTGGGPLEMSVVFDPSKVQAVDLEKLRSGSFKVVVRGDAGTVFGGGSKAEADLQVTFTFVAYQ